MSFIDILKTCNQAIFIQKKIALFLLNTWLLKLCSAPMIAVLLMDDIICLFSCSSNDHLEESASWPHWLPSLEYAEGYLKFKLSTGMPLIGRLFRSLLHDPVCPTRQNSKVLNIDKPHPVVIFSHGMGSMRTTYSILLSELASNGNFVAAIEHKDGSGKGSFINDVQF